MRSAVPFTDTKSIEEGHNTVADALAKSGLQRCLIDLRGSPPGRNDPEYERSWAVGRKRLNSWCPRTCVLVRSAAGRLPVQRLMREDGLDTQVFQDEAEAWDYLLR